VQKRNLRVYEPTFSGMFWIYRDDLLRQMRSILVSFARIKRCRRNAVVVRGLHFQIPPAAQAKVRARIDPRRRGQYPPRIAGLRPAGPYCEDDEGQSARNLQQ
jgi:hypothetical protein